MYYPFNWESVCFLNKLHFLPNNLPLSRIYSHSLAGEILYRISPLANPTQIREQIETGITRRLCSLNLHCALIYLLKRTCDNICSTFDRCWRNCWFKINRLFELKYLNTSTILAKIIEHACFVILHLYRSLRRTRFQLASYSLFTMKSVLFTRFHWHLFIKIYRINMPIDERLMYLSSECSLRDNIGSCSSCMAQSN